MAKKSAAMKATKQTAKATKQTAKATKQTAKNPEDYGQCITVDLADKQPAWIESTEAHYSSLGFTSIPDTANNRVFYVKD